MSVNWSVVTMDTIAMASPNVSTQSDHTAVDARLAMSMLILTPAQVYGAIVCFQHIISYFQSSLVCERTY